MRNSMQFLDVAKKKRALFGRTQENKCDNEKLDDAYQSNENKTDDTKGQEAAPSECK